MNKLNIDSIKQGNVTIDVSDTAGGVMVSIAGDIDMQDPSVILDPLFEKVHAGALGAGIKQVEADFRKLTFLNSSGIKAMAKWIMKLTTTPADSKYTLKILHNKEISWQATSLPTLTFLAPGMVSLA
jgi:hypothetical protein